MMTNFYTGGEMNSYLDYINTDEIGARISDLEEIADEENEDDELTPEMEKELDMLRELEDDISGLDGPLIKDSEFQEYAQTLAEDLYGDQLRTGWPFDYIDWERAAEALEQDYTSIDFDGESYWIR